MRELIKHEDEDFGQIENMMMMVTFIILIAGVLVTLPSLQAAAAHASYSTFSGHTVSEELIAVQVTREYIPEIPLATLSLTNDGPSNVYIDLNNGEEEFVLTVDEIVSINKLGAPTRITSVKYRCIGDTATVIRLVGEW